MKKMENTMNEDKEVSVESVSVDDVPTTEEVTTPETNPEIEKLTAQLAELNDKYGTENSCGYPILNYPVICRIIVEKTSKKRHQP